MAFAGVSLIVDGKLCDSTSSPFDARADSGYHLLVVQGYSNTKGTTPNKSCISSRPFLVGGHRWIVKYYPNGKDDDDDNEEYMSLILESDDDVGGHEGVSQGIKVQYELSFIDQPELQVPTIIRRDNKYDIDVAMGYSTFMRNDALERSRHLKNDSFAIRHFSNLLLTKEGADITFEVGGKKFAAHRIVLAARSTVFKAQLFGAMDEGATAPSVLKINDIEANVFSTLLTFIYTDAVAWFILMEENEGDIEEGDYTEDNGAEGDNSENNGVEEEEKGGDMEDNVAKEEEEDNTVNNGAEEEEKGEVTHVLNLLEAAVHYDLQKLKIICEETLASYYLTIDSVADIIVVAERRGYCWLKDVCLEYIKSHTSVHKVFTADLLDQIIRTTSLSGLKELISKFRAS
ncbi:BTB/POZ and MATH domain-containing protein 3-like [Lolium rigidum]|uniref:BTB/POZ and MATH domain-containing protein 3-like n=1 Tax=Lolium rigidum TaxID=89674 RepID=UPI001F5CDDB3|nr:BTB/POZ and MATH domain-containing protein 3-like [Lolium rigidum]